MKKYIPYIVIAILLAILVFRKQETVTITVPEQKGSFEVVEPEPVIEYDTIYEAGETKLVELPNPINQELLNKYQSLKDSVQKLDFVKGRLTERTYKETFKDSTQQITVESKVIGTLQSQKVDYTVFEQKIDLEVKKPSLELFLGTYTTIPTNDITAPSIGANINLKTPKTIYSIGYDNQKNITAGIAFKLF